MNNSTTTNINNNTSNTSNANSANSTMSATNTSASNSASNSNSNTPGPLAFGVELEMVLRPKPSQDMERMKRDVGWDSEADAKDGVHRLGLLNVVERVFASTDIDVQVERDDGPGVAPDASKTWKVTGDATLKGESDGYWGAELISPVMYVEDNWQKKIDKLYLILAAHFEIKVDRFYGTHVHVSRGLRRVRSWDTRDISGILKSVCLFQGSIFEMLPLNRKDCKFARCNFSHEETVPRVLHSLNAAALLSGDFTEVFSFLDGVPSLNAFAELYDGRYHVFNLSQLKNTPEAYGTVEFRGAPGSPDPQTASHWVAWVLCFVAKAVSEEWSTGQPQLGTGGSRTRVSGLRHFIQEGERLLPAISQGALDGTQLRAVRGQSPFTPADIAAMDEDAERGTKGLKPLLGW